MSTKKQQSVQISAELFSRLCAYHLLDRREPEQERAIKTGLQSKLSAMQRRTDYAALINKKQERQRSCESWIKENTDSIANNIADKIF